MIMARQHTLYFVFLSKFCYNICNVSEIVFALLKGMHVRVCVYLCILVCYADWLGKCSLNNLLEHKANKKKPTESNFNHDGSTDGMSRLLIHGILTNIHGIKNMIL